MRRLQFWERAGDNVVSKMPKKHRTQAKKRKLFEADAKACKSLKTMFSRPSSDTAGARVGDISGLSDSALISTVSSSSEPSPVCSPSPGQSGPALITAASSASITPKESDFVLITAASNSSVTSTICSSPKESDSVPTTSTAYSKRKAFSNTAHTFLKDKAKHKVGFNPKWKNDRPWLSTNSEGTNLLGMFCELCRKQNLKAGNGTTVWSKKPCSYLRVDSIISHESSAMHIEALRLTSYRRLSTTSFESKKDLTTLITAMKTLELLIRHNVPHTTFFKSLIEFAIKDLESPKLAALDGAGNMKYTSPAIQNEFSECMAYVCRKEMQEDLLQSPAVSILIDETTDIAVRKHLGLAVKYLDKSGEVITTFFDNVQLANGTAECITEKIEMVCKSRNIPITTFNSIGTDGASVMTGCKTGVVKRLRDKVPKLIGIHCHNHRLSLAAAESFNGVPLLSHLNEVMDAIFVYYHYSANKTNSLKEMQSLLQEMNSGNCESVTIKKAAFTRWLSHIRAASSIRSSYSAILADLENAVAGKLKTTGTGPTPEGLLKNLKSFKLYLTLCWLNDVLVELSNLTLALESNYLTITYLECKLALAIGNLKKLQKKPGIFGRKAERKLGQEIGLIPNDSENEAVYKAFQLWIPNFVESIQKMFENQEVIFALGSLDLRKANPEYLGAFADDKIFILSEFFEIDEDLLIFQWATFKEIMKGNTKDCDLSVMYKTILHLEATAGTSQFKELKHLIALALTLPLSTAVVERMFSQVKNIVSSKRSQLGMTHISDFLSIKFSHTVNYEEAAQLFLSKKNRRIEKLITLK